MGGLLALATAGAAWAGPIDGGESASGSRNIEKVAQIPLPAATDLELFTRRLDAYREADGSMVRVPDGAAPVTRHFAMVGSETTGARIVDVTNPERPYVVSQVQRCSVSQGDVQITPDGTTAAIAFQFIGLCHTADGKRLEQGAVLVDLGDVYAPRVVAGVPTYGGAHTITLHPGGRYLYVSNADQTPTGAHVPVVDIADPSNPKVVTIFEAPGNTPHDIQFSADGTRAYMAGISQSRIVDTSDPTKPRLISTIVPPGSTIGHDAAVSPDKAFLFLGDEAAGGNGFPCPGGGIYVYDIRVETEPELLGIAWAGNGPVTPRNHEEPHVPPNFENRGCTAHVMSLNPDGRSLSVAWYSGGVRTFGFSGLYGPGGGPDPEPFAAWGTTATGPGVVETGYLTPAGASTWAAKQYAPLPGYVFAGDRSLGFYVGKLTAAPS